MQYAYYNNPGHDEPVRLPHRLGDRENFEEQGLTFLMTEEELLVKISEAESREGRDPVEEEAAPEADDQVQ